MVIHLQEASPKIHRRTRYKGLPSGMGSSSRGLARVSVDRDVRMFFSTSPGSLRERAESITSPGSEVSIDSVLQKLQTWIHALEQQLQP